jgi:hypothetical protein
MWKAVFVLLMSAGIGVAQVPLSNKPQADALRKETPPLQGAINDVISGTVPGFSLLQPSKATYLEGYGLVIMLEVSLEPTRNPFSSSKTPEEVRTIVTQRRKEIKEKLVELLKQRVAAIDSVGPADSVSIIVYILNTNPADLPDLPSQVVLSMKKQDALDFQNKKIADLSSRVTIREF